MAFWKKKKPEERVAPKPAEKPVVSVYMGEVIVEIKEYEEGKIVDSEIQIEKSERTLTITNKSSIPVFSTELILKNYENTSLDERIFIHRLEEFGKEGSTHKIEYELKEYKPPISFKYRIEYPQNKGTALWFDIENDVFLILELKSNIAEPIDEVIVEYLPSDSVSGISPEEPSAGEASGYTDRCIWTINNLAPEKTETLKINLKVRPNNKTKIELGKISINIKMEGAAFSSVSVDKAVSRFLLNYKVDRDEYEDEPGMWDITVNIQNPYELELQAEGEIEITKGEVVGAGELQFAKMEANRIELVDAKISPNGVIAIGPIKIKSTEIPQLKVKVGGGVEEKIFISSEAKYEAELPELDVIAFDIEKEVNVVVEERMKSYVEENEIPTLGENYIEVASTIANVGGVDIGHVKIVDLIPRGMAKPEKITVKLNGKNIKEYEKELTETEEGINLMITLRGEKVLPKGKKLSIKYKLTPAKISRDIIELRFPMHTYCAQSPETEGLEIELPIDKIPTVKVRHIIRKVSTSKTITPTEKDVFIITLSVENKGDAPIIDYELKQIIPPNFEILETEPQTTPEQTEEGSIVQWKLTIEPYQTKELKIKVRGVGEYTIDDLMQAETI